MTSFLVVAAANVVLVAAVVAGLWLRRRWRDALRRAEITGFLEGMNHRPDRDADVVRLTPRQ